MGLLDDTRQHLEFMNFFGIANNALAGRTMMLGVNVLKFSNDLKKSSNSILKRFFFQIFMIA